MEMKSHGTGSNVKRISVYFIEVLSLSSASGHLFLTVETGKCDSRCLGSSERRLPVRLPWQRCTRAGSGSGLGLGLGSLGVCRGGRREGTALRFDTLLPVGPTEVELKSCDDQPRILARVVF